MSERGFLLTTTYRSYEDRTEVRFHAVLESGHRVLILDDRLKPYLFVREHDWALASRITAARVEPTNLCAFDGEPVAKIDAPNPERLGEFRDKLVSASVEPLESDVRFVQRWLVDHGIFGSFSIEGTFEDRGRAGRVYKNPRLLPARFVPQLTVMSFDIETSLDGKNLFSIASSGAGGDRVFIIHHGVVPVFPITWMFFWTNARCL
jgi:DNA polymerase II